MPPANYHQPPVFAFVKHHRVISATTSTVFSTAAGMALHRRAETAGRTTVFSSVPELLRLLPRGMQPHLPAGSRSTVATLSIIARRCGRTPRSAQTEGGVAGDLLNRRKNRAGAFLNSTKPRAARGAAKESLVANTRRPNVVDVAAPRPRADTAAAWGRWRALMPGEKADFAWLKYAAGGQRGRRGAQNVDVIWSAAGIFFSRFFHSFIR